MSSLVLDPTNSTVQLAAVVLLLVGK